MRTRLAIKFDAALERWFPERRVFLKSDSDTRFIRLRPVTQLVVFTGSSLLIAWTIVATAVILMDSIGSGNFREQAKRDQRTYQARLNDLAGQRDARATEAHAAQERFNAALTQISVMQSELLESETRRRELETGIEVIQSTLRGTMKDREEAREKVAALTERLDNGDTGMAMDNGGAGAPMDFVATALAETAAERDQIARDAEDALLAADELSDQIATMKDQNDAIFRQLEDAMTISVAPLDKMFRAAGMPTKQIIEQVRRGYSGQGGPLTPLSFSTRGEEPSADALRANRLLNQMDQLNMYRIAAQKAPFALPVKNAFRFTSSFGYRRDPKTGGRRMHKGVDFAAPTGTPLYATADGVVTHAGWSNGYGRLVKIQHDFGIETRYAHMSQLRVKVGQRVSRGDRIGDMGASGRVTGVHLHYEVRVGGKAVNPMIYIKAANDVF
ncbi:peptidoglycan DD-metalloendopeptidase family protein [Sulfitobacter pseudonitzschiae]|uniref:Peptidoglycan DD-metalloendopeptidase family protein n=1 Tax=Pseudosulfitobacter pseudonitzschiae TaxID=1402135 RepID=A0A9Q2S1L5_9RHOB|nr:MULTISPECIES: M23 family metallopeptidase [Roseobacteraceae]MBM2292848.1 peptidoglycan DD-metalloendopeptidase family protein [Pseudosulfitobacter pseudonitzschiae]MBM2298624.1 peptidoglycan DD-metalloendopeptidase family protein [Pseudosulfitobacter pseudonitzschiae]MBM2303538.1 peptidoglycan DD-metalloendopeptidase family protein [Pseudosulfitobacter pseudonitzschiae]MBM2313321.1 peptidoglycan DD-metalloendopeptidase family protein [Pseudosulfitobacter pseudonitzschiae]MBM2318234.1 peptid